MSNIATILARRHAGILRTLRRAVLVSAFTGYVVCGTVTVAAPLSIADTPLFLTSGVEPNLIMAIDDSASMDLELLMPANDGSAWWWEKNDAPGTCLAANSGSFLGCGRNAAGTSNVPATGVLNFNVTGGGDFFRYSYLFPNGDSDASNLNKRRLAGGAAIPPLDDFAWARAAEYNGAYFDPTEIYAPWESGGGRSFSNSSTTAARFDPVFTGAANVDLTKDMLGSTTIAHGAACSGITTTGGYANDDYGFTVRTGMVIPVGTCIKDNVTGWEWEEVMTATGCVVGTACQTKKSVAGTTVSRTIADNAVIGIRFLAAHFYATDANAPPASFGFVAANRVSVPGTKQPGGVAMYRYDIIPANFGTTAQYDAAIQNFANWFTYYRRRHMALRGGLGAAFKPVNFMRVGAFTINSSSYSGSTTPASNVAMGLMSGSELTSGTPKYNLYDDFYDNWWTSLAFSTPNRLAVYNIVRNYKRTSGTSPAPPVTQSCQRNFGMLFTDGYSNQPDRDGGGNTINDGITNTNVDGTAGTPYADTIGDTMADHVMDAYNLIRGTPMAQGKVQPPAACADSPHDPWLDCNVNPHMNFYAITLGSRGLLFDPDTPNIEDVSYPYTNTITWPTSVNVSRHPTAVDDIWHATINGRGQLLNARSGNQIASKLAAVLNNVRDSQGSAASAAVSSGTVSNNVNNRAFSVSFNTRNWSGVLRAQQLNPDGTLGAQTTATLPAASSREIFTVNSDGTTAVPFRWASLDATRQGQLQPNDVSPALYGENRLDYLRGDRTREAAASAPIFRKRAAVLGDIVNSAPVFVGAPPFRYKNTLEASPYSTFVSDYSNPNDPVGAPKRPRMIYVGSNDGMLHAYKTQDDVAAAVTEAWAFVPGAVFKNLHRLADPAYSHRYYVDGTVSMTDAYFAQGGIGTKSWKTVLAGGLNRGGQGIYALDVTEPGLITETDNFDKAFLWEFTDADDADMGYSYSRPAIVRMHNGEWAVIFGNGYNSTETVAGVDAIAGTGKAVLYIVSLETKAILKKISLTGDTTTPNGLSTPLVADLDGDGIVDAAYAGDLLGNMWKFDLSGTTAASWDVYGGSASPKKLYSAGQPITTRPQVGRGLNGQGQVVLFGTGKFLESTDRSSPITGAFYGIYDTNVPAASFTTPVRANLLQQTIVSTQTVAGVSTRVTSANLPDPASPPRGWYLDLAAGEMQVSDSVLRNGRVGFSSIVPDADPCNYGGTSWFMLLDAITGSRLTGSSFDVNTNGVFDAGDLASGTIVSGIGSDAIMSQPRFVAAPAGDLGLVTDTLNRTKAFLINPGAGRLGRQSWRQLR